MFKNWRSGQSFVVKDPITIPDAMIRLKIGDIVVYRGCRSNALDWKHNIRRIFTWDTVEFNIPSHQAEMKLERV